MVTNQMRMGTARGPAVRGRVSMRVRVRVRVRARAWLGSECVSE